MKSILLCSVAVVIGSTLFISCAQKRTETATSSGAYNSSGKDSGGRPARVKDTGPRQNQ
jgi:hypothetical protein